MQWLIRPFSHVTMGIRNLVSTSVSPFQSSHKKKNFAFKKLQMDIKKLNIPTLDGPNWGTYSTHLQAAAQVSGFWELIKGEALRTSP